MDAADLPLEITSAIEQDGGLISGHWYGDDDTREWLRKLGCIDERGRPTQKLKLIVPNILGFICIGPGVSYG